MSSSMLLIKDLGIMATSKKGKSCNYGLYECIDCKKHIKVKTYHANTTHKGRCSSCAAIKRNATHKMSNTRLYKIWQGMKGRCYNSKNYAFANYGGRGVAVCEEWINDFDAFRRWSILNGYKDNLSIDKDILSKEKNIDPPIYSPNTCMWVTKKEQCLVKRLNTRAYSSGGKKGGKRNSLAIKKPELISEIIEMFCSIKISIRNLSILTGISRGTLSYYIKEVL